MFHTCTCTAAPYITAKTWNSVVLKLVKMKIYEITPKFVFCCCDNHYDLKQLEKANIYLTCMIYSIQGKQDRSSKQKL